MPHPNILSKSYKHTKFVFSSSNIRANWNNMNIFKELRTLSVFFHDSFYNIKMSKQVF